MVSLGHPEAYAGRDPVEGTATKFYGDIFPTSPFGTAAQAGSATPIVFERHPPNSTWGNAILEGDTSLHSFCEDSCRKVWTDHTNFYSWITMRDLLLGIGAGSVLANTSLDDDFQGWYQRDVRRSGADDFAALTKEMGEGQYVIPAVAGIGVLGAMCEHTPSGDVVEDFGFRSTRAYCVGTPPMLLLQFTLGASRPGETSCGSRWNPFDDVNAVSGHAYVGAVPFITAARMTDNRCLKGGFYLCSTFTAWSRVNDDKHYLSQACLGWWVAYLACRAIDDTETEDRRLTFSPIASSEMVGVGAVYRR